jgi:hypothetical protein
MDTDPLKEGEEDSSERPLIRCRLFFSPSALSVLSVVRPDQLLGKVILPGS